MRLDVRLGLVRQKGGSQGKLGTDYQSVVLDYRRSDQSVMGKAGFLLVRILCL